MPPPGRQSESHLTGRDELQKVEETEAISGKGFLPRKHRAESHGKTVNINPLPAGIVFLRPHFRGRVYHGPNLWRMSVCVCVLYMYG
jgi:hypothetical protein